MLPSPSASFTLPSLYDDLELDCRLYFPRPRSTDSSLRVKGCAIFAHPYASLGGSFDDPVVHSVGTVLLQNSFVLATFNFRGAETSQGKTSWNGRAELGDYASICAFFLAFLQTQTILDHFHLPDNAENGRSRRPLLVLGGYSYGSMIAANQPDINVILRILNHATEGTSEYEIKSRAHELAQAFLGYCETRQHRGRTSLNMSNAMSPTRTSFGGYESPAAARRISREGSRRSMDTERVRQSLDKVRRKLGSSRRSSDDHKLLVSEDNTMAIPQVVPLLAYVLISPLLGPVSSFATLFSKLKFERRDVALTAARDTPITIIDASLTTHSSLIVFGTADHFTSSRKVRSWCESMKHKPTSLLQFREVLNAGHFWHEENLRAQMTGAVSTWLQHLAASK